MVYSVRLMDTLKTRLKARIEQSGMSINGLAKKAGVPQSSIKNILYGKSQRPSRKLLSSLANALQCQPYDFLPESEAVGLGGAKLILKHGHEQWDAALHLLAYQMITNASENMDVALTQAQANHCIEGLYSFAKKHGKQKANLDVAMFLVSQLG